MSKVLSREDWLQIIAPKEFFPRPSRRWPNSEEPEFEIRRRRNSRPRACLEHDPLARNPNWVDHVRISPPPLHAKPSSLALSGCEGLDWRDGVRRLLRLGKSSSRLVTCEQEPFGNHKRAFPERKVQINSLYVSISSDRCSFKFIHKKTLPLRPLGLITENTNVYIWMFLLPIHSLILINAKFQSSRARSLVHRGRNGCLYGRGLALCHWSCQQQHRNTATFYCLHENRCNMRSSRYARYIFRDCCIQLLFVLFSSVAIAIASECIILDIER